MTTKIDFKDKSEFVAFIMVYSANVDGIFSNEECEVICKSFGDDIYQSALEKFNAVSDYEALQAIINYKEEFYKGEKGEAEILSHIDAIFESNESVSPVEKEFKHSLTMLFR